uniref:Uncharacterized protein n=1 Tax=Myotis myotis TaxID=51298 RepID=A0A7J7S2K8_MYOMY|nr:hypothetical protein mMyoMyo1_010033 [Myotis myotis]
MGHTGSLGAPAGESRRPTAHPCWQRGRDHPGAHPGSLVWGHVRALSFLHHSVLLLRPTGPAGPSQGGCWGAGGQPEPVHRHLLEGARGLATSESTVVSDTPAPSEKPSSSRSRFPPARPTPQRPGLAASSRVCNGRSGSCVRLCLLRLSPRPCVSSSSLFPSSPVSSTLHGGRGHRAEWWLIKTSSGFYYSRYLTAEGLPEVGATPGCVATREPGGV